MFYMGIVNAEAAFTYIATVTVLTFVFGPEGLFTGDILLNLFGGGLIMGGCYMLTDYRFVSRKGKTFICDNSRCDHCRHPYFQQLSRRYLLWYFDSELSGRIAIWII